MAFLLSLGTSVYNNNFIIYTAQKFMVFIHLYGNFKQTRGRLFYCVCFGDSQ